MISGFSEEEVGMWIKKKELTRTGKLERGVRTNEVSPFATLNLLSLLLHTQGKSRVHMYSLSINTNHQQSPTGTPQRHPNHLQNPPDPSKQPPNTSRNYPNAFKCIVHVLDKYYSRLNVVVVVVTVVVVVGTVIFGFVVISPVKLPISILRCAETHTGGL